MAVVGKTWIAHYVFSTEEGEMRTAMKSIVASNYDAAMENAARRAPAEEFIVSVHAESDDQFLGAVRQQAAALSDRSIDAETLEALYDGDDEEEEAGND